MVLRMPLIAALLHEQAIVAVGSIVIDGSPVALTRDPDAV